MKFIEDIHKYVDEDQEYVPVTYFIKKFEPFKDWKKIAETFAKKHGRTTEDVLAEWDKNKNEAAAKGTRYHAEQERILLDDGSAYIDNVLCPVYTVHTVAGIKEDKSVKLEDNTIYPEKMIWSRKYHICGTADIVIVRDKKIHIKDYKTNKKLDFESYKHPVKGKEKMKFPLTHLDCCNFNTYQLQLNLYMYMLLQQNRDLKIGTMTILHVIYENGLVVGQVEVPVKNMQKEIKTMLEYYKNQK